MARVTGGIPGESGGMARGVGPSFGNDNNLIRAKGAVLKNKAALNARKIQKQNEDIVKQINKLRQGK